MSEKSARSPPISFVKRPKNLAGGRSFCKQRFKYLSPRVNQDTLLRRSFLKRQCSGSVCSFVFFPGVWGTAQGIVLPDANAPMHG